MNLKSQFSNINDYFSPKIIDEVNDQFVKLAKLRGRKFHGITMKMKMSYFM